MSDTICSLLSFGRVNDHAIGSVGTEPLTFAELREHTRESSAWLRQIGIGRNERVAIALPNGPEMATAFLSVGSVATAAPLNPAYNESEFEFYLKDLRAKALIVPEGGETAATRVADRLDITVIRLISRSKIRAGLFTFSANTISHSSSDGMVLAEDIALVLHTSGTTSKPKLVPLTHKNICNSAQNISETLLLTPEDRCLNIMPLFHIHGLVAALLASISSGSSVHCSSGFNGLKFFTWFEEIKPTWYTAVPTMHQAILARAQRNKEAIESSLLRFIRSSSAALPTKVMEDLENFFKVPVIESYGMTESAHQMASNPLPPGVRKSGTVGIQAGPKITILDEFGEQKGRGIEGEICIQGPNVMMGYEANPESNTNAFINGWFRTGDQGYLDDDGYLTITGRLKEIINRGGEKIAPLEVDEVLMQYPSVLQAISFAIPHEKLGEDLAAAIVPQDGATIKIEDLRNFVSERLVKFKVPKIILLLDKIPTGPTGKIQRIGLAKQLGLNSKSQAKK